MPHLISTCTRACISCHFIFWEVIVRFILLMHLSPYVNYLPLLFDVGKKILTNYTPHLI